MRQPGIKLRPSNADRSWHCPASLHPEDGEPVVDFVSPGGVADIGSAAHAVFARVATHKEYTLPDIAGTYGVKVSDLQYLKYTAHAFVELLEQDFGVEEWISEKRLEIDAPFPLKGTPDLIGVTRDGKTLIVVDYKTGRASASHEHQIRSYVHLALHGNSGVQKVVGIILWARDQEVQAWTWSPLEIDKWAQDLRDRVYHWDGRSYTIGEHCSFCPRFASCEARSRDMQRAHELLNVSSKSVLSPDEFKLAWQASISIPNKIKAWRERVKEYIQTVHPINMGDGRMLDIVDKNTKAEIDTVSASIVLQDGWGFSFTDLLDCCSISKTAVEDKVASEAKRGMKGKSRKEVMEDLEKQGALTRKTTLTLQVVDIPKGENV